MPPSGHEPTRCALTWSGSGGGARHYTVRNHWEALANYMLRPEDAGPQVEEDYHVGVNLRPFGYAVVGTPCSMDAQSLRSARIRHDQLRPKMERPARGWVARKNPTP